MSSKSTIAVQTVLNMRNDPNLELLLDKERVEVLENKIAGHIAVLGYWKAKYDKLVRDYYRRLSDDEKVLRSVVKTANAIMSDTSLSNAGAVKEWAAWCKTRCLLESQTRDPTRALMPPPPPPQPPRGAKRRKID